VTAERKEYTTQLGAGLGLIAETRALLELWQTDMDVTALYQAALQSGRFPTISARRLRNIVVECFAPRYLANNGVPARCLHKEEPHTDLSQEELLQQPVYIPFRALKDPRDICMLDPACGSMHFGLYAFDLFEVVYDEAWEIVHGSDDVRKSSTSFAPFMAFVVQYPDKAGFLADVPRLIIEHNIHGIDIDQRAVQIAGLSLWLRAQRTWQQQGLRPQERPRIRRSNLVCAEPMPGEEAFLDEFIEAHLSATPEHKLLGQLVRRVFDAMKLAGEAGSLLKIEEEIAGAVVEAKQKWLAGPTPEQSRLFADDTALLSQMERSLDVTGITDESFWEQIEERIYTALQAYAEQAEHGGGYQRRLFADDAARGFAFIDLCRKRYNVVVMNPPFGAFSRASKTYAGETFPSSANDIFAAFVECSLKRLVPAGLLGAITSRTGFFIASFSDWRREVVRKHARLLCFSDLGGEVMDNATVKAAAYVLQSTSVATCGDVSLFLRFLVQQDKAPHLMRAIEDVRAGKVQKYEVFWAGQGQFALLPDAPFVYWANAETLRKLSKCPSFEPSAAQVRKGLRTGDNFRFVRALWEIPTGDLTPDISSTDSLQYRERSK